MHSTQTIKTLIHVHTNYSYDSDISLETLAASIQREGIDCIAVTDHDTIEGAVRLQSLTDANVIVGEEITTREGHLIGLFLKRQIEPGKSALESARAIREQGGLVLVPHPFVRSFGCGLRNKIYELVDLIDAVEVFNAQNLSFWADGQARQFAKQQNLPTFVGSDSHSLTSIAPSYQIMPCYDGPDDFLVSLRSAVFTQHRHPVGYFITAAYRLACYFTRRSMSAWTGKKTVIIQS